jgi:hypothetical protein
VTVVEGEHQRRDVAGVASRRERRVDGQQTLDRFCVAALDRCEELFGVTHRSIL